MNYASSSVLSELFPAIYIPLEGIRMRVRVIRLDVITYSLLDRNSSGVFERNRQLIGHVLRQFDPVRLQASASE